MIISEIKDKAKNIREAIDLKTHPVGVKFIFSKEHDVPTDAKELKGYRYCQALMLARQGKHVTLDGEGISCPAAAAAFGFKPLPAGLQNGQGLVGFGITREDRTGIEMFKGMTTLTPGKLNKLYLFPLEQAVIEPDIVVVEDSVENLMWIALGYLNSQEGKRVESSTAILQATCVDATIIPFVKNKMNLSYGCYGCRDATDIGANEAVLGFPFNAFDNIGENLVYLSRKAIPNSRGKNALTLMKKQMAEKISQTDIFQDKPEEVE